MSSGATSRQLPRSGSSAAAVLVAALTVVVGLIALLAATSATADAVPSPQRQPYPPTQPCAISASARSSADDAAPDVVVYDVIGTGLDPRQDVRVSAADTGRVLAVARTDDGGAFRVTVSTPRTSDGTPVLAASTPTRSCTSAPPGPPGSSRTPGAPSNPPADGLPPGSATGGGSSGGSVGGAGSGANGGTTGASRSAGGSATTGPSGSASTSSSPGGTTRTPGEPTPPRADAPRTSPLPFGIGLGIAAALLVLGTLAVLLLTRRPER